MRNIFTNNYKKGKDMKKIGNFFKNMNNFFNSMADKPVEVKQQSTYNSEVYGSFKHTGIR